MKHGFTLVELLVTIGIFAILATLTSINFFSTYAQSNLGSAEDVLIADLKTAQSNAMSGQSNSNWYIEKVNSTQYRIMPENFLTTLPSDISLSTTLPSDKLEFARISGEVVGYASGQNSLILTSSNGSKTISVNQYGTITGE